MFQRAELGPQVDGRGGSLVWKKFLAAYVCGLGRFLLCASQKGCLGKV